MHRLLSVLQHRHVIQAPPEASVHEVAVTMTRARVGAILIMQDDELLGIFSERDLMTRVVVPERDPHATRVSEVMTTQVETATLEDRVDQCVDTMKRIGCRHLPVRADGEVIGIVSMRDLLRDELNEQADENRHLKAYLHQQPL